MKQNTANIRKENNKALSKLLWRLLLWAAIGGVLGVGVVVVKSMGADVQWQNFLSAAIAKSMYWGTPVCSVLLLVPAFVILHKAKQLLAGWDGEDESCGERIEYLLNWPIILSSLMMPILFLFFSVAVVYAQNLRGMLFAIAEMLVAGAAISLAQQKAVDLTRVLNPEKRGSVYEFDFHKKWMNSCDENEQRQIGQAAYFSFQSTNKGCIVIWAVLLLADFVFQTGLLPMAGILAIWCVLQGSYYYASMKITHKSKQANKSK